MEPFSFSPQLDFVIGFVASRVPGWSSFFAILLHPLKSPRPPPHIPISRPALLNDGRHVLHLRQLGAMAVLLMPGSPVMMK